MTDYEVTIPEWGTFEVNGAPPDLTTEQLLDIIKKKNSSRGIVNQGILGGVSGFAQFLESVPVLLARHGPAAKAVQHWMPDLEKMLKVKREAGAPNAPVNLKEEFARTSGEFLGSPLSYIGGASGSIKNLVGKAADAVLAAVGSEGMHQLAKAAHVGPLGDALAQFAGSILGPGARAGAKGIPFREQPVHDQMVETLRRKYKVFPTAGDVRRSKALRWGETTLGALPGAGAAAEREATRVSQEVGDALLRLQGIPESVSLKNPGTNLRDVLLKRKLQFENDFTFVADELGIDYLDGRLGKELRNLVYEAHNEGLSDEQLRRIEAMEKSILHPFAVHGKKYSMNGDSYLALTQHDSPLSRAMEADDPSLSYYATKMRTALDDAMERTADYAVKQAYARGKSGGQAQAEAIRKAYALERLKEVRRQYFTFLTTVKAFGSAGSAPRHGEISAQRLSAILNAGDDNKMRNIFERSNLRELADAAAGVISNLANSSTAERGHVVAAAHNLGAAASRALHDPDNQRLGTVGGFTTAGGYAGSLLGPAGALLGGLIGFVTPGLTGKALLKPSVQRYLQRRADPLRTQRLLGPATTAAERAESEINPPGGTASVISSAHAAPFKPIDPSNPSYTDPGAHARPSNVENPARAAPKTSVPPRYRESSPNAKYYQPWTKEELDMAEAGQVPPGRTANQMHRQRQLQGFAKPRTEEEPPLESQPGFARDVIGTEPAEPRPAEKQRPPEQIWQRRIPRITVQALPPEQRSPETVLDNPEGDPLQ
jgi:hypothetical protein